MDDINALKQGVLDGTIDAVATDHAPHADHQKELALDAAPPGMLGLQTALGVLNTAVALSPAHIASLMSWAPARIAGVGATHGRSIAIGEPANIAVWDTTTAWQVSRDELASRSRNTPYHGMTVKGRVHHTVLHGEVVVHNGQATK